MASVPVASWVSVWSIRIPIGAPGSISPSTRWAAISFCATFLGIGPSLLACREGTRRAAAALRRPTGA